MTSAVHHRSFTMLTALVAAALATVAAQSSSAICSGPLGQLGWQCTTVDPIADTGSLSHLTYAAAGTPVIAYSENHGSKGLQSVTSLKFASRTTAGTWTTQTIDSKVGAPSALQLHPLTGRPAISYGCLKLAEFTGAAWAIQTVVAKGCGDWGGTFAYDQAGVAVAAYTDTKKRLVVGQRSGSSWAFQTVNQLASAYKSMAVAPDGTPSIAFEDFGTSLVFGRRTSGGAWQFTTVEPEVAGSFISHVKHLYDDSGAAAIAYKNGSWIRYARLDPTSNNWVIESAHTSPAANWFLSVTSLTFVNGDPVIVFQQYNVLADRYELFVTRRTATGWTLPSMVESVAISAVILATSAAYNASGDMIGISYGPRGAISDLRFAEGPASVLGE